MTGRQQRYEYWDEFALVGKPGDAERMAAACAKAGMRVEHLALPPAVRPWWFEESPREVEAEEAGKGGA